MSVSFAIASSSAGPELGQAEVTADHRAALREIESLMSAKARTAAGDRLDVLVTLVEASERKRIPLDRPDAIAANEFTMARAARAWARMAALGSRVARATGHEQVLMMPRLVAL